MDDNDTAELHQHLDDTHNRGFEMAQASARFAQNWYLVANAGGVTASIGYLGAYSAQGPGYYAGLVTLSIFLIGFGLSMHSATLHARLLGKYAADTWQWVQLVKNDVKVGQDTPKLDMKIYDQIGPLGAIGRGCAYGGGGIGLISLWIGQVCRVMG